MAIFDFSGSKPIEGYRSRQPAGKRTLGDPGTLPPGYATGNPNVISAGFKAGGITNLTRDFVGRNVSADLEIFQSARRLRARARDLSLNNPHFIKFLAECEQNIVGENGIQLQAKITGANGKQTATSKQSNQRIEEEWRRWGKKGRCTADGGFSFTDLQRLAVRTAACEGENLTKFVYDRALNECAFALQPLDNDQLDDQMMSTLGNGNQVRMGVEVNDYGRPQAYHVWSGHPADMLPGNRERVVVPARLVNHLFIRRRPAQRRGYTWASGSLLDLNALDRYEEAVIVAARASAAKFMVITQDEAEGYTGEDDTPGSEQEASGMPSMSANAGEAMVLEPGQKGEMIDPRFPTNNHRDFLKTKLRSIATGLLMSYPTLGNDLESVNFSSIRAGLLDERDCWRILQRWFIEHFMQPIFEAWLQMARVTVLRDIEISDAQVDQVRWHARGWDWVDPLKDSQANALDIQNAFTTHSRVLAARGLDLEDIVAELAAEQALFKAAGITVGTDTKGVADTASDDQQPAAGADGGVRTALSPLVSLGLLVDAVRTPQQIADALEGYRTRLLPAPTPEEKP